MRSTLLFTFLFLGQVAYAQTMNRELIKEEMLLRVDHMLTLVDDTRSALKKDDVVTACHKIDELFGLYPDHIKSIGGHMDLFDKKTITAKKESLAQLIEMHQQSLICKKGRNSEYLNVRALDKWMKTSRKSLRKQKKTIKKADTSFNNSFYYHYEF